MFILLHASRKGRLLAELDSRDRRWRSTMVLDPLGHEAIRFEVDETRTVGKFADERVVDAAQMLTGVMRGGIRFADVGFGS